MSTVAAPPPLLSPEAFLLTDEGKGFELIDGELEKKPVSFLSSQVGATVNGLVFGHVKSKAVGVLLQSDCTYQIFPDDPGKYRRPDGSFFRVERVTPELYEEGHVTLAPDWVQETLSPGESAYGVDDKVEDYLRAGVKLVWVINPAARTVLVYRLDGTVSRLHAKDELSGEEVIPGFRCKVAELFPAAPTT